LMVCSDVLARLLVFGFPRRFASVCLVW